MKQNKKAGYAAWIILILALLAAVGSLTVLGPCVHEDGTFGSCHWAGRAMTGVAFLLAALSLICLGMKESSVRKGLYIAMVPTALLGILIPDVLIRLCGMATMRCRAVMRPAMTILFVLIAAASVVGCILSHTGKER